MFSCLKIVKFYLVRINFMTLLKPYQRFLVSCRKKYSLFVWVSQLFTFCNLPVLVFFANQERAFHSFICLLLR